MDLNKNTLPHLIHVGQYMIQKCSKQKHYSITSYNY